MARGLNKVTLIGNVGQDPEVRFTPNGDQVANFSIATTESWTKDGQKQEKTEWHRLVAFRKLAEIIGTYVKKGSKLYIEGKLQTRSWEDKDGQKKYTTEIVANEMLMLDSKGENQGQQQSQPAQQEQQSDQGYPESGDTDLPF